jgi:hypothetical protein
MIAVLDSSGAPTAPYSAAAQNHNPARQSEAGIGGAAGLRDAGRNRSVGIASAKGRRVASVTLTGG